MAIFTGDGVAIVTPFNEDGSINYDRLDELIEFHCEHKTDSIVICGTTGEASTMTHEEHIELLSICRRKLQNMGQMVYFWLHLIIIKQLRMD